MKKFRKSVMVVALCGALLVPASVAFAKTGEGLNASELVHWLGQAAEGNMGGWEDLYDYAQARLRTTDPEVAREVQEVVFRAAFAGAITPCSDEFLGERIQEDLEQISLRLAGKPEGVVAPAVCEVAIVAENSSIVMAGGDGRPDKVQIFGYNFDSPFATPRVYVTHATGIKSLQPNARIENFATIEVSVPVEHTSVCALRDAVLMVAWDTKLLSRTSVDFGACDVSQAESAVALASAPVADSTSESVAESAAESGSYYWGGYWDSGNPPRKFAGGAVDVITASEESSFYHWEGYWDSGNAPRKVAGAAITAAAESDSFYRAGSWDVGYPTSAIADGAGTGITGATESHPVYGPNPSMDAVLLDQYRRHGKASGSTPVWSAEGGLDDLLTEMATMRAAGLAAQQSLDAKVEAMQR